jgi:DNA-binding CsgD family transcriptional regulator
MPAPAKPAPQLTELQTRVLALAAQGLTYNQIRARLGITAGSVRASIRNACARLGAANTAHAVHLATLWGLIGWYPDCGDHNAYLRHRWWGEPPDRKCLDAHAGYRRDTAGRRRPVRDSAPRTRQDYLDSKAHGARGTEQSL